MNTRLGLRCVIFVCVLMLALLMGFKIYTKREEDKVLAVVLRAGFNTNNTITTCYVRTPEGDPGAGLLSQFRNERVRVRKASEATFWPQRGRRTNDPRLNEPQNRGALYLTLEAVNWHGPFKADTVCHWPGAGTRFTVVRQNGTWVVVDRDLVWIS